MNYYIVISDIRGMYPGPGPAVGVTTQKDGLRVRGLRDTLIGARRLFLHPDGCDPAEVEIPDLRSVDGDVLVYVEAKGHWSHSFNTRMERRGDDVWLTF